jgi:iron complex outermembrane receptor protein
MVASLAYSQDKGMISGKILDAEMYNEPLLMASVSLKDTDFYTLTNFNGNFEIPEVKPGKYTLQIRFLGYEPIDKKVELTPNDIIYVQETIKAKALVPPSAFTANNIKHDSNMESQ